MRFNICCQNALSSFWILLLVFLLAGCGDVGGGNGEAVSTSASGGTSVASTGRETKSSSLTNDRSFTVSGRVSSGGVGVPGVEVSLSKVSGSGRTFTAATGSKGDYIIANVPNGTGTLSFTKQGYTFSPANEPLTINGSDVSVNANVVSAASGAGNSISGRVTLGSMGLANVKVAISGKADGSTTTDSNGNYAFDNLDNGSYTITPTKSGYMVLSTNVTVNGSPQTLNFIAMTGGVAN